MSQTSSARDFSLFSLFTAGLACMIPFASAYTQPTGDSPEGNPIYQPGLNSIVPAGEAFSITWDPTTKGTVTLVLLKGPSSNAEPQYAIAEKIPNSGTFAWTPSSDLEPSENAQGYGLQLIVDATGAYQYTTQFGISNPDWEASDASSAASTTSSESASSTAWTGHHGHGGTWSETWSESWATSTTSASASSKPTHNITTASAPFATGPASGVPHNVTIVAPTGALTVPTSLKTSVTTTSAVLASTAAPVATPTGNGAAAMGTSFAGLVFAGAVAVFAL